MAKVELYENAQEEMNQREIILKNGSIIKIKNQTNVDKFEQHMHQKTHYAKYKQNRCTLEENETMDILWYYPYELQLMLEKYRFKLINQVSRFLNNTQHTTVIAEKQA